MVDPKRPFTDRKAAGILLGQHLTNEYNNQDVLILGIPRGGVEVAYEVAGKLNAELSAIVTKKLPGPDARKTTIGAVSEGEEIFLTPLGKNLNEYAVQQIVSTQFKEIQTRVLLYREGRPLPYMEDRTVIIVDDIISTGATLVPAINLCKHRRAGKIIIATPAGGSRYAPEISQMADELIILKQAHTLTSVAHAYDHFQNLSDDDVAALLNDFEAVK